MGWGRRDAQADCLPSLVGTFLEGKYDMDWYLDRYIWIFGYSYWEPILFCFFLQLWKWLSLCIFWSWLGWDFEAVKTASGQVWKGWRRQWTAMPNLRKTHGKSWEQTANHPKWRKNMFRTSKINPKYAILLAMSEQWYGSHHLLLTSLKSFPAFGQHGHVLERTSAINSHRYGASSLSLGCWTIQPWHPQLTTRYMDRLINLRNNQLQYLMMYVDMVYL